MTDPIPDRKPFDLDAIARLIDDKHALLAPTDDNLREMSKFSEHTNRYGLAAHAIHHPVPPRWAPWITPLPGTTTDDFPANDGEAQLPGVLARRLGTLLRQQAHIVLDGALGGAAAHPFAVRLVTGSAYAHLAAGLRRLIQTDAPPSTRPDYTLLIWGEPIMERRRLLDPFVGHWPRQGLGFSIGYDDPRLPAAMMLDAARRRWRAEDPATMATAKEAASVWTGSIWPTCALMDDPEARAAALAPGSLPFGMAVDADGRFPHLEGEHTPSASDPPGFVIA